MTDRVSKPFVDRMREVAGEATPGPWKALPYRAGSTYWDVMTADYKHIIAGTNGPHALDALYIAAASPDLMVKLLEVVVAAQNLIGTDADPNDVMMLAQALARLPGPL